MNEETKIPKSEESFKEWMTKIILKSNDLSIIQKAYIDGFNAGYQQNLLYKAEEWLQK